MILEIIISALLLLNFAALVWLLVSRKNDGKTRLKEQLEELYTRQMEELKLQHRTEMDAAERNYTQQRQIDQTRFEQQFQSMRQTLQQQSEAQFKALALELLKQNTDELKTANSEQLEQILNPLKTDIESFRKAVDESYVKDNAARESLRSRVDDLMKLNVTLGEEARNLTSALKGKSKVQGDWGEMILRTLLERCGLTLGVHFKEQLTENESGETLTNESNRSLRPDVAVYLPGNRMLIIDSKVSLTDFLSMNEATTEKEAGEYSKRHLRSVKKHIDELATKKYQNFLDQAPDYVMMFIPVEGAYIAAIQEDPRLWEYAWQRHVAIVSPTHLFSVMHVVSHLWRQDNQNRNALEIAKKGKQLHNKIVLFMEAFQNIGRSIKSIQESYDTAFSRLSTGKGNVVRLTQDLEQMGVGSEKPIPSALEAAQNDDSAREKVSV